MMCQICGKHRSEVALPDGYGDQVRVCGYCEQDLAEQEEAQ